MPDSHDASIVVYPTGEFPDDVDAVQAAADEGGTVVLKSVAADGTPTSFNFGPAEPGSGHVELTRDVRLLGESSDSGYATIEGGYAPVRSFAAISTEIRGISFKAPMRFALFFLGAPSAETVIVGNRVTGLVGQALGGFGSVAEGIVVRGGAVVISDNVVEETQSDRAIGISQFRSTGPVQIARNQVFASHGIGIEATANDGSVTITDNKVDIGSDGLFSTGIEVNGRGSYRLSRNIIRVHHPAGVGIFAFSPGDDFFAFGSIADLIVERNEIVIDADFDAMVLIGSVSDAFVGQNRISGRAGTAFWLQGFGTESELASNTFLGNDIGTLTTTLATAFLDEATRDNAIVGRVGELIDLGTGNRYSGDRRGAGLGPQIRNAKIQRTARVDNQTGWSAATTF